MKKMESAHALTGSRVHDKYQGSIQTISKNYTGKKEPQNGPFNRA